MLVACEQRNLGIGATLGPLRAMAARRVASCFALVPTAWGECAVVWNNREDENNPADFATPPSHALLRRILTPGRSACEIRRQLLNPNCDEVLGDGRGNFRPEVVPDWFPAIASYLQQYYTTSLREWTRPQFVDHWTFWRARLDWSMVTTFQRLVLEEVAGIPRGVRRTYGQVAALLGRAGASRAVGAALRANPWPVLVPCHRVVGHGGKMTGFSAPGGIATKRRMLALEGALFS